MLVLILLWLPVGLTLDNGLAKTPPLGWGSWERFGCNTDCLNYPDDCISEKLVRRQADELKSGGYRELGYRYLLIDDCWQKKTRSASRELLPDPSRFQNGMAALADYVHKKGLKLGLYTDVGHYTCAGFPGSKDHYEQDAKTMARWGIDMVKMGGCNVSDPRTYESDYTNFGQFLNKTGWPFLYSCNWPLNLLSRGKQPDYKKVSRVCNTFRSYAGIVDSWPSLENIIKFYGGNPKNISQFAGSGHWNDPDQMVVGDFGLSYDQQQIQMAVWSVMSAPLFLSVDLHKMPTYLRDIVQNKEAIAINQDALGLQAYEIAVVGQVRIWRKSISPAGSFALAIIYTSISGGPTKFSKKLTDLGLTTAGAYNLTNVFTHQCMGLYKPWFTLDLEVNPTGVKFIHAKALY